MQNNKAACLNDMLCEQIKHIEYPTLRCLLPIFNSIFVSHKFPTPWSKSKVIAILKAYKNNGINKELQTNFSARADGGNEWSTTMQCPIARVSQQLYE